VDASGELQRIYGMTGSAWTRVRPAGDLEHLQAGFYTSFARRISSHPLELIFTVLAAVEGSGRADVLSFLFGGLAARPGRVPVLPPSCPPTRRVAWLAIALSAPVPSGRDQEAAATSSTGEHGAGFALLAAWAGVRGTRRDVLFCLLTLTCKEDQVYTVAVVAILMSAYGARTSRNTGASCCTSRRVVSHRTASPAAFRTRLHGLRLLQVAIR